MAAAGVSEKNITVPGMIIGGGCFFGGWCWRIYGGAGRAFSVTESRRVVSRASSCTCSKAYFSFRRISRCCCAGAKKFFFWCTFWLRVFQVNRRVQNVVVFLRVWRNVVVFLRVWRKVVVFLRVW